MEKNVWKRKGQALLNLQIQNPNRIKPIPALAHLTALRNEVARRISRKEEKEAKDAVEPNGKNKLIMKATSKRRREKKKLKAKQLLKAQASDADQALELSSGTVFMRGLCVCAVRDGELEISVTSCMCPSRSHRAYAYAHACRSHNIVG